MNIVYVTKRDLVSSMIVFIYVSMKFVFLFPELARQEAEAKALAEKAEQQAEEARRIEEKRLAAEEEKRRLEKEASDQKKLSAEQVKNEPL